MALIFFCRLRNSGIVSSSALKNCSLFLPTATFLKLCEYDLHESMAPARLRSISIGVTRSMSISCVHLTREGSTRVDRLCLKCQLKSEDTTVGSWGLGVHVQNQAVANWPLVSFHKLDTMRHASACDPGSSSWYCFAFSMLIAEWTWDTTRSHVHLIAGAAVRVCGGLSVHLARISLSSYSCTWERQSMDFVSVPSPCT